MGIYIKGQTVKTVRAKPCKHGTQHLATLHSAPTPYTILNKCTLCINCESLQTCIVLQCAVVITLPQQLLPYLKLEMTKKSFNTSHILVQNTMQLF